VCAASTAGGGGGGGGAASSVPMGATTGTCCKELHGSGSIGVTLHANRAAACGVSAVAWKRVDSPHTLLATNCDGAHAVRVRWSTAKKSLRND
jgi:hypothetical protein